MHNCPYHSVQYRLCAPFLYLHLKNYIGAQIRESKRNCARSHIFFPHQLLSAIYFPNLVQLSPLATPRTVFGYVWLKNVLKFNTFKLFNRKRLLKECSGEHKEGKFRGDISINKLLKKKRKANAWKW